MTEPLYDPHPYIEAQKTEHEHKPFWCLCPDECLCPCDDCQSTAQKSTHSDGRIAGGDDA